MYAHDGRLHFHRPFLDRLTNHKPDAPCALAAFLLLNVIDEMRHADFDADAVNLRINAVYNPLGQTHSGDPQVFHLVRIAEKLRLITQTRNVASVTSDVIGYANWLTTESRFDEALSVLESGSNAMSHQNGLEQANLQFRRGFALRQIGMLDTAAAAYGNAALHAHTKGNEELSLLSRIGMAKTWRLMGLHSKSKTALLEVDKAATSAGFGFASACARHDLANETRMSAFDAIRLTAEAFDLYDDQKSRQRCLADLGYMLVKFGFFRVAKRCLHLLADSSEGTAFHASVLGTNLWVSAQTEDRRAFEHLQIESQSIEEKLAVSTQSDIQLRLAQGYIIFDDSHKAKEFLLPALEVAERLKGSQIDDEIRLTRDVLDGTRPRRDIVIEPRRSDRVNKLVSALDTKLANATHRSGVRSLGLRALRLT